MTATIRLFVILGLTMLVLEANAGTLSNEDWKPSNCGEKPEAPEFNEESIEAFNQSVLAVNEWLKTSSTYMKCLADEANADTKRITDSAAAEQKAHKELLESLDAKVAAFKEQQEQQGQ